VVEGTPLLREHTGLNLYREFESLHLRQRPSIHAGLRVFQAFSPQNNPQIKRQLEGVASVPNDNSHRASRYLEAERKACDIRLRAERRAGELLKDLARTPPTESGGMNGRAKEGPATPAAPSEYRQAIDQAGIPERTARNYQALANVPKDVFEEALRDPVRKPTTTALIL